MDLPPPAPAAAPLNSNEKALAISVLVMGALVVLFSITTLAGAAYILATGKVMGGEMSRSLAKLGKTEKNQKLDELMEAQLATQAEVQKKWAPAQLGTGLAYLGAVVTAMALAIIALSSGRTRRQLGIAALTAAVLRIAEGIVTFLLTNELMRSMADRVMSGLPKNGGAENAEKMRGLASGAMAGLSAISAGCMMFVMCGYFAVVAFIFLSAKKPVG